MINFSFLKKLLHINLIISILIILSVFTIDPFKYKKLLDMDQVEFSTLNVNKENKWSKIDPLSGSGFFIHPGEYLPSILQIDFKSNLHTTLHFNIAQLDEKCIKNEESGITHITILENDIIIDSFTVTRDTPHSVDLKTSIDHTYLFKFDKGKHSWCDWNEIKFEENSKHAHWKNILLSSILIILIWSKKEYLDSSWTLLLFLLLMITEKIQGNYLSWENICYLINFALFITLILYVINSIKIPLLQLILKSLVLVIVYLIPAIFILNYLKFHLKIDQEGYYALFQSNPFEMLEFLFAKASFSMLLISFLFLASIPVSYFFNQNIFSDKIKLKTVSILLIITFNVIQFSNSSSTYREFNDFLKDYNQERNKFRSLLKKRKKTNHKLQISKNETGETHIVLIGESLSKSHMHSYGYYRNTTPNLSKLLNDDKIIQLSNAHAVHVHTNLVLPLILTESNQFNQKDVFESLSIIEVLNEAKFNTYWISNQNKYGEWDNNVSILAEAADKRININKSIGISLNTSHHDEDLIPHIKKIIHTKTKMNKVIFVHLMGNHLDYSSRYPDDHNYFKEINAPVSKIGSLSQSKQLLINQYDNSVLYNDSVVSTIINELDKINDVSSLSYFSDHSEDLNSEFGHSYNNFTYDMIHTPTLFWFSKKYKKKNPSLIENLNNNKNKIFPNDLIFNTLMGIYKIRTDFNSKEWDLSNKDFSLSYNNLKIKDHPFLHTKNKPYYTSFNINEISNSQSLKQKIVPHRVNTVGKIVTLNNKGINAFEVDMFFRETKNGNYFEIGHDSKVMTNISFEELIKGITFNKIWMDIKNLKAANMDKALNHLNYLDSIYHLKEKVIVESSSRSENFKLMALNGYHSCYYLPVPEIHKAITSKNKQELINIAKSIAKTIDKNHVQSISFPIDQYDYINSILSSYIPPDIKYQIWNLYLNIDDTNLISRLTDSKKVNNQRVETFLINFKTLYDY